MTTGCLQQVMLGKNFEERRGESISKNKSRNFAVKEMEHPYSRQILKKASF